jgi:hypothetical protein
LLAPEERRVVIWMTKRIRKGKERLLELLEGGGLIAALERYVRRCHSQPKDGRNGKKEECFPNAAGFCRYLGVGLKCFEELSSAYPILYDNVMTLLEDEALNAKHIPANSVSLTAAYFKRRLGYAEEKQDNARANGEVSVVFDHDIMEAGR